MNEPTWYSQHIEEGVRDIVRLLRDNGVNTESSCEHEGYIQCQYMLDGLIWRIHTLLWNYLVEQGREVSFSIDVSHEVCSGHQHSRLEVRFPKPKSNPTEIHPHELRGHVERDCKDDGVYRRGSETLADNCTPEPDCEGRR